MARGWESKSVESQIESAEDDQLNPSNRSQLSAADLAIEERRKSLLLYRSKVQQDLEKCRNDSYRNLLNRTLADLDRQLSEFKSQ
jgi:hypothetical protein